MPTHDQSFSDRSQQLQKNIYESGKGRLRLIALQQDLAPFLQTPCKILDVGAGEGRMSEWALQQNPQHQLVLCDSAKSLIDSAKIRLSPWQQSATPPQFFVSDLQNLCESQQDFDWIFCHAVLEWVHEQPDFIAALAKRLKPGGRLSLMFYNALARELSQLVYGNFDYIEQNYQVRQRVKLNPHRPLHPDSVLTWLSDNQLNMFSRRGIRVFYDIMRHVEQQTYLEPAIISHELRIGQQAPFWQLGRYIHFMAVKAV